MSVLKRVLVVGSGSGIGREAAIALSESGCEVVAAGRSEGPLNALEALLRGAGREAHAVACDVRSNEDCARLVEISKGLGGGVEPVLVNCVGIARFEPFHEALIDDLRDQVETNLLGAIFLCHEAIPWMLEEGKGHIVNVSSAAAVEAFTNSGAYGATKAAMLMLTRTLAAEYRDRGIRFSCLLPGSVDTPLWERQSFCPPRAEMLSAQAVGEAIRDIVMSPADRSYDEILLMPPKGVLRS